MAAATFLHEWRRRSIDGVAALVVAGAVVLAVSSSSGMARADFAQGSRHVRGQTDGPDDLPDVHAGQGNGARAHALKWQRYPKPEDPTGFTQ